MRSIAIFALLSLFGFSPARSNDGRFDRVAATRGMGVAVATMRIDDVTFPVRSTYWRDRLVVNRALRVHVSRRHLHRLELRVGDDNVTDVDEKTDRITACTVAILREWLNGTSVRIDVVDRASASYDPSLIVLEFDDGRIRDRRCLVEAGDRSVTLSIERRYWLPTLSSTSTSNKPCRTDLRRLISRSIGHTLGIGFTDAASWRRRDGSIEKERCALTRPNAGGLDRRRPPCAVEMRAMNALLNDHAPVETTWNFPTTKVRELFLEMNHIDRLLFPRETP